MIVSRTRKLWKPAAIVAAVFYLVFGVLAGTLMKVAIPAINPLGAAYIALTWPAWLNGSPVRLPIPRWAFTFPEE